MLKTFKAILKNNTLQWLDETPEINSEYPVNVYITLLEENIIGENRSNGQKMANALKKIANNNTFTDVDTQQWQQQNWCDRSLPDRD
ncbi:MAG: hypothetical protein EWV53_00505 [Microcystis panniformis Mp_MB_F_20051200_S9]|uniref:Uncharacterized protein n=1 Tax=Microcystis panniformis Mp_MB_F_20051200_S9 TaxID=2486223 RepID=A0A552QBG4_9CHRO|nr:MAG: hypothetical protein EWV43_17900 [Microcystis panniformis Mp_MB_F_20080800_S26D]TRV48774.1 MAG: hypothetical protein EWV87_11710 [Microcystis panniformis Mp_GB_SS_20050300_S99]TRV55659.1 MAG: hypothetical protein EWV42_01195 [Microcystis panniformis Mp_GB_SS_20050300_S99D]TRV56420.1 MAG: hypothetical protein EWV69_18085 [Microcystis panniformis Mp_MB_F_20080800_S26]TRV60414.1 MAG: hypothetical protein EWV86_16580 [Microcystis panniformis Mp_MB_F_20051200_S9D]TRV66582.1 MAG: hypothetica